MSMLEQIVNEINKLKGQRCKGAHIHQNTLEIYFEEDVLRIHLPEVSVRCIGCLESEKKVELRG